MPATKAKSRSKKKTKAKAPAPPSIPARLRAIGKVGQLQKQGVAAMLGVSPSAFSQYLSGERPVRGAVLRCLELLERWIDRDGIAEVVSEVLGTIVDRGGKFHCRDYDHGHWKSWFNEGKAKGGKS